MSELVYWRGSAEVNEEVFRGLEALHFRITEIRQHEELLERLEKDPPVLLLVDASAGEKEASERIVELSSHPGTFAIPTVFLSVKARAKTELLRREFNLLVPIEFPFSTAELLRAIQSVSAGQKVSSAASQISEAGLDPRSLVASFGGRALGLGALSEVFDDDVLIPEDERREEVARAVDIMTVQHEWLGGHLRRVAFVASAVGAELNFDLKTDRLVRLAGLLLNWGLYDESPVLVNADLFHAYKRDVPARVAAGFTKSARKVVGNLGHPDVSNLIKVIAAVLRAKSPECDEQTRRAAGAVFAAELVDRSCWSNGMWDRNAAHRAFRLLPKIAFLNTVPDVARAVQRVIVEASTVQEVEQSQVRGEPGLAEQVEVSQLRSGFRLAAPLEDAKGKELLETGVVLDDDLVGRVWKLSAIRPLKRNVNVVM